MLLVNVRYENKIWKSRGLIKKKVRRYIIFENNYNGQTNKQD